MIKLFSMDQLIYIYNCQDRWLIISSTYILYLIKCNERHDLGSAHAWT